MVHLCNGNPCTICGRPLEGDAARDFLARQRGAINVPSVFTPSFTGETPYQYTVNMGGWISVEQATPAEEKRYLVFAKFNNHSSIHIAGFTAPNQWMCHGEKLNVTHWQPLPITPII